MSAESQQGQGGPVKFVAVDLYERLIAERARPRSVRAEVFGGHGRRGRALRQGARPGG